MARVAEHLSVEDLEAGFRSARDPTATRHVQVIWLLARGHTIADVAAVTSFVPRWIEQLLARYNAHGPEALGDLRRRNGSAPSVLRPELLARLPERLKLRGDIVTFSRSDIGRLASAAAPFTVASLAQSHGFGFAFAVVAFAGWGWPRGARSRRDKSIQITDITPTYSALGAALTLSNGKVYEVDFVNIDGNRTC